jgi:hypothetical protein
MKMKELFDNGTMCYLKDAGAITPTVFRYKELHDELKRTQEVVKTSKTQAVSIVADKCKVGEKTVWRADRFMKR